MHRSNQAEREVVDIVPTTQIPVTTGTVRWLEMLYEAGAVSVGEDGEVLVDEEVRALIRALHGQLAGGDVEVRIRREGGALHGELEATFDRACEEAAAANEHRDDGEVLPYTP